MNIQTYILPEWKKAIGNQDLSDHLEDFFVDDGESMAEYLDRYMMRTLPTNWFEGWSRYQFPLHSHALVIDLHKVIASHFSEFIEKYRAGRKDEFRIPQSQVNKIQLIEKRYKKYLEEHSQELNTLREEIRQQRKVRPEGHRRKQKHQIKEKPVKKPIIESQEHSVLDHEYVYKKWMEMVESKPISKSYWHIHDYLSRYILDFAKEHSEDGRITKQVIEDFIEDYGRGKRPKTMNHYNRVVARFWEFYEELEKDNNPMEVW